MDLTAIRRRLLPVNHEQQIETLILFYGQGLNRTYDVYDTSTIRCRTSDVPVKAGQTVVIEVPTGIDVATGAWNANTKANILYSGWNSAKTYTPTVDALVKYVFRNFSGHNLDGAVTVTVGNKIYKS